MTDKPICGLQWSKSSYSSSEPDSSCVEVAASSVTVHVRDSKDTAVPGLALGPTAWAAFVAYAAEG